MVEYRAHFSAQSARSWLSARQSPSRPCGKSLCQGHQGRADLKLLRESLNEAIRENNLRVLSISEVENVEITEDRTMSYRATIVTAPEFELPDYSTIPAEIAKEKVTEESVSRWIDQLREPHATYTPVDGRSL